MVKKLFLLLLVCLVFPNTWQAINSSIPTPMDIELLNSNIENTQIKFTMDGFHLVEAENELLSQYIIKTENGASILDRGYPDLQKMSTSIIIPDQSNMSVDIISFRYHDYQNVDIIPSKGNLTRDVNPDDIPLVYADIYTKNEFYPSNISELSDPYILRDLRGQTLIFNPFQYNAVSKTLRVYTEIVIEVYSNGTSDLNAIDVRNSENIKLSYEYDNIYSSHFINYNNDTRFDYLIDQGNMLVICYDSFLEIMQPFVDWKNKKGIPTLMVSTSQIGQTPTPSAAEIEDYINNYYYLNGLTFVLLVGDASEVPPLSVSGSASDPSFGCIEGNDFYAEVIIGRFSGSFSSDISTQVQRSIEYEQKSDGDYFNNALGIASNQGPGYGGMDDAEFNDFLWETVLELFTYDDYQGIYDPNGSDNQGITAINNGIGIINYTGHGSQGSWGNGASLSSSQINSLTNTDKLPFVITVGCNVGEFNTTAECFCEAWQRATYNGAPSGGIGHFGSTISQSWEPPMHGQWAMNKILTENFNGLQGQPPANHKTRSIGGIATNGCLHMNDAQGTYGINETKYWTLFGDPSLIIRTDTPSHMNVSHDDIILVGQETFTINTGLDGALAALSLNGELLASSYASESGVVTMDVFSASTTPGIFDLVVTGFNAIFYESQINVVAPEGPYVTMSGYTEEVTFGFPTILSIDLQNIGTDSANELIISLTTDDAYVTMTDDSETITLDSGESATVNGFSADIASDIPNGHQVEFSVYLVSGNYNWDYTFNSTALAPEIALVSFVGDLQPGSTSPVIITMVNDGGTALNYPMVDLQVGQYLTVSNLEFNNAFYWDMEDGYNIEQLFADISVSDSAPMGSAAELTVLINQLNSDYQDEIQIETILGQVVADFESELVLDWENSSPSPWAITNEDAYSGMYSFKSGDVGENENNVYNSVSVDLDVTQTGEIEFYYRVSAEYSPSGTNFYDGLEFYIDNVLRGQFQSEGDGSSPWRVVSVPVISTGMTEFKWVYVKDGGGGGTDCVNTGCLDAAFIDQITFPPVYIDPGFMLGDTNGDSVINILDVVLMIGMVLGTEEINLDTADLNGDGIINILDVTLLINLIIGSHYADATSAIMDINADGVSITSDGYIGAIQITLSHDDNFILSLTDDAFVADYRTNGNTTTLIVVVPEDDIVFTTLDTFKVDEVLVANSQSFINVTESVIEFGLSAAYPNPFNPTTTVEFSAAHAGYTSVKAYNLMGQLVGVLLDGMVDANVYTLTWDAQHLPSGVYMIKAESNGQVATQKIMLLK